MYNKVETKPIRKVRRVEIKHPCLPSGNKKPIPDVDELIFSDTPLRHSER